MEETQQPLNLPDIPDVNHLLPSPGIPWWVWVIVLVVLAVGFWLFRMARTRQTSPEAIAEKAYRQALASLEQSRSLPTILEQATATSLTLRSYFAQSLQDPSLFETHEEFMARHNALATLPEQTRGEIAGFFATLARYKYAPNESTAAKPQLVEDATTALHHWHQSARAATPSTP
jgi:hypothetical protein